MTEETAEKKASSPVSAGDDDPGPSSTQGTTGSAAEGTEGAADGPTLDPGGDRPPSALTSGTLGRSDIAALGAPAAEAGSAPPPPESSAGNAPASSASVVPASLRPEPRPASTSAQSDAAPTTDEAVPETAAEGTSTEVDADTTVDARAEAAEGEASAAAVGATMAESAPQDQLGRPGRPALAFAAIAGVVLMVTPFAVNETSQRLPGTTVDLVDQEGVLGYFMRSDTDGNGQSSTMTEQQPPSGLAASGLMPGVEERPAPDSGYVPEVLPQEEPEEGDPGVSGDSDSSDSSGSGSGASPDGEPSGSSDNEGSEVAVGSDTSENENEDVSALGNERGDDTRGSGSDGEPGDPGDPGDSEDDGDFPLGDLPDHNTNGPLTMTAPQDSEEGAGVLAADEDQEGEPTPEGTSAVPGGDVPATEGEEPSQESTDGQRPASVGEPLNTDNGSLLYKVAPPEAPEAPEGQRSQERTEEQEVQEPAPPQNTEGVDEDPGAAEQEEPSTIERLVVEELPPPLEFRYAEVAGVGCAPGENIAYGTAGEFWEGDGTHSWAFGFEGGFAKEECDGRWHAIPVSGDPDAPNGRYAFWTFDIGFTDAQCEIYVHIPDAESPRWVGGAPAQYQLHPSADPATSEPFESFTVDQVADKGGWVHVGSYTPPGDTISVKLQNSGADQIDGQDTNAHVVASAVRTRCN